MTFLKKQMLKDEFGFEVHVGESDIKMCQKIIYFLDKSKYLVRT